MSQPSAHWQRALLLVQQGRWDLSVPELRATLGERPDHALAHALLAMALSSLDQFDEAMAEAERAIALDPELPPAHASLAIVCMQQGKLEQAVAAIERTIALDPHNANHFGTMAQIRLRQRRWQDALAAAERGLELAPDATDCLNLRSTALVQLGRRSEARDTLDASLARDPDNPYTHQTRGIAMLHAGDAKGALHHFQEALRRDPTLDVARHGLLEALKARNPLYRLVLGWFLWLDRFTRRGQRQILIGLWAASLIGRNALESAGYPTAALCVGWSWLGFVLLTACSVPFFNLLLLLHPIGRNALERRARNDAILLGLAMSGALIVGAHAIFADSAWSGLGWLFWCIYLLPIAGIGLFHPSWGRRALQVFCVLLVTLWLWWAVAFEHVIAENRVDRTPPVAGSLHAKLPLDKKTIEPFFDWIQWLQLAAALSTWFVLLAPKGRPPRRAR